MFKKLSFILTSPEKRSGLLVGVLMIGGMVSEMLGISLIFPLLAMIVDPDAIMESINDQAVLRAFRDFSQDEIITMAVVALFAVYALKNGYLVILYAVQAKFIFGVQASLSSRLLRSYMQRNYEFFLTRNTADLLRNVIVEVNVFTNALQASLLLMTEALVILGVVIILMLFEPFGTIISVCVIGLSVFGFMSYSRQRLSDWGRIRQESDGQRIRLAQESFGAIKELKVGALTDNFVAQYDGPNKRNSGYLARQNFFQNLPKVLLELSVLVAISMVVWSSLQGGADLPKLIPVLGLFGAAAFRILPSVNRCLVSAQSARFASSSVSLLFDELSYVPEEQPSQSSLGDGSKGAFESLDFQGVSFRYSPESSHALTDISCSVSKGEFVAIVGPSGAGKSTLVGLMLGLLDASQGSIFVNQKPMTSVLNDWRKNIGYVPQNIFLVDRSVAENIALGVHLTDIDPERIEKSLRLAQLDNLITDLPDGLETKVGERGVRFSGGQLQRIGIARALYHEPAVLILDEATSALDFETEAEIVKSLDAMRGEVTCIIVTHRVAAVESCDKILRLNRGYISSSEGPRA